MFLITIMLGVGLVLIFAAVKGMDPRDLVREAIGGKNATTN